MSLTTKCSTSKRIRRWYRYAENEVGSYRRTFKVPADWKGRRVVLCCEGVISFYYVWVNGKLLGYNQGSKTAAEWDITDVLNEGENVVALEVYRWSSGCLSGMSGYVAFEWYRTRCVSLQYSQTVHCRL